MKEPKVNLGNSQREKIITKELKIGQNVFIFNGTVIPLHSISKISVAGAAKEPYQLIHFLMVIAGVVALFTKTLISVLTGILLIGIGGWLIYRTYEANRKLGEYLVLSINSGRDIYIYSDNHRFTVEVIDVIINCINSGKEYKINMENCSIEACQFGDGNMMS